MIILRINANQICHNLFFVFSLSNQHSQTSEQQEHQVSQEQQEGLILSKNIQSSNENLTLPKKPLFKCLPCRLTFSSKGAYHLHKKRHTGSK